MSKIFIGVDLQKDFIDGGALEAKGSYEMIGKLADFLDKNGNEYDLIALTADWHNITHCSFKENGGIFDEHCIMYSSGASIDDRILHSALKYGDKCQVYKKGIVSSKEEYSIFQNGKDGLRLMQMINLIKPSEIHICGLVNEYCVLETVKDLEKLGLSNLIRILKDYVCDLGNPNVLFDYARQHNIIVLN